MAELRRVISLTPDAFQELEAFETPATYILAVIAANRSDVKESKISIWVLPGDIVVPSGESDEAYRAYIIKNASLPPSGTYETWRFSMVANDKLFFSSNNGNADFSVQAINQSI